MEFNRVLFSKIMVSVNKSRTGETIKKKVTFSFCTEKSDRSTILNKGVHEPLIVNCVAGNIGSKPVTITHKKPSVLSLPKHCEKRVCDVKKTLVRNVEQTLPVPPQCMVVRKKETAVPDVAVLDVRENSESRIAYKSKYAAPELYSSLCIAKEIQLTANKPDLQQTNIPKAAKQMLDEKILWKDGQSGSRKEVKFRSRDPEPKLSDFFTPSKGKEYVVVPDPPISKPEKIRKYNGFSIYERSQQWNSY
ncbi:hypothetical protein C0J52_21193 [Blattella germanica]|nr:hypothetical protein C0J52_21193 [Blattella germanica]